MRYIALLSVAISAQFLVGCHQSQAASAEKEPEPTGTVVAAPTSNDPAKWNASLDAVAAAPNNHKIVLENDRVRVLEVTVQPGEKEPLHEHRWASVLYVQAKDKIRDYNADGKVTYDTEKDPNPKKAPYTIWMEPQSAHAIENLSKEPLRLIRVELKK
ncbi:MAG TPA: hypothetical protein VIL74_06835 [Pyrinomonadaceae bacterium]|jgi:quercetin dioxygenase-like cupin family protein